MVPIKTTLLSRFINAIKTNNQEFELIIVVSITAVLITFALLWEPRNSGDGAHYFGMVVGLSQSLSPEVTDTVREIVKKYTNKDPASGHVLTANDGKTYPIHFWFYPLLCVPAYKLLTTIGMNPLKCFQLTNSLLITFLLLYFLVIDNFSKQVKWFIIFSFLLSTGTIYFQWTHPEVFTAVFVLISSIEFLTKRYASSALFSALASLQNPSVVFFIPFIFINQLWDLYGSKKLKIFSFSSLLPILRIFIASLISLIPYIWSFIKFGAYNPIVKKGYINYSLISFDRFFSFVFDLNQGLIVGMPLFIWAVPLIIIIRFINFFRKKVNFFINYDQLLLIFIFLVIPVLAQVNWNAGHSVFIRYASWSGMVLLVWVGINIEYLKDKLKYYVYIPALVLQSFMMLLIGGILVDRLPGYLAFQRWVLQMWEEIPHIYDPLPEIFYERLVKKETSISLPAVLTDSKGSIIRILSQHSDINLIAHEVCGPNSSLLPADNRNTSRVRVTRTEGDLFYITGRLTCSKHVKIGEQYFFGKGGYGVKMLVSGWSNPEAWGVWSDGDVATLNFTIPEEAKKELFLEIESVAYVVEKNPKQIITITLNDFFIDQLIFEYPNSRQTKILYIPGDLLSSRDNITLKFNISNPSRPSDYEKSEDRRRLGIGLISLKIKNAL